ncbi:CLUMA_CG006891, isoform A [Clunio marinus]|uniref:non-specific serine/threonine protein kinase n=1 Tax=Clunio marinus TaxID=568069 RepID=A0A1J1I3B2_9DIPT|nr:CLUMA_CG006891, isoform A [Clunio marinus]
MASQGTSREFVENWNITQTLGEGAYGEVKLLINRLSGEAVAMKMVDLKKHPDAKASVKKEVCIQKILSHENILKYFGTRTQGSIEYIFLEYAAGGELFDRIEPDVGMEITAAQRYFNQILSGVEYLHSRGVAHRDLKPENILLDDGDNIKISDFGMATVFRLKGKERLLDKKCGTLPYVAPEILVKPYMAQPADIWSCGIILVTMMAGELPWDQPSSGCKEYLAWRYNKHMFMTPWSKLDTLSLSFIRKILNPIPEKRLTLENIKQHKWIQNPLLTTKVSPLDMTDGMSPLNKRLKSIQDLNSSFDDINGRCYQSQPAPSVLFSQNNQHQMSVEARNNYCFSQPAMLDDLLLCTQQNATQGSTFGNPFQRLVKRMTRFFVSTKCDETIKRLTTVLDRLGFTWKINEDSSVTISTLDGRKLQLTFKANFLEMDGKILLDFRLSKGCGLDFKRKFVKIKNSKEIDDVVLNIPVNFTLANSVC